MALATEDRTSGSQPHQGRGSDGRLPPGPRTPGSVQTLAWMNRPIPFMERCRERYGRIFSMRLGPGKDVVMIADPLLAKEVMAGDPEIYRAGETNGIFRPVVGSNSILLLDGESHMHQRRILLKGFGASHGMRFAEQVREIAQRRIAGWQAGQTLRLADEMEAISFEAIMRVVFDERSDESLEELRSLIPEMMDRCDSPFTLIPWFRRELGGSTPYAKLMRVLEQIDALLLEMIASRREDPLTGMREDVVSLLLRAEHEDGSPITDREIRDELLTMIMAGYETTTSGLAWALERLLHSPEQLRKLQREIEDGDDVYLDAVVKETLRARPVIPVVARHLAETVELGGYVIPAGCTLMVSIYLVHNDPETYLHPEEFRPDRFLSGIPEGAAWIPFGGGVRRCLGARFAELELKIVLAQIVASARLSAVGQSSEGVKRKRFTFAPDRGAEAIVDELLPPRAPATARRFRPDGARATDPSRSSTAAPRSIG
jgi:cytochrome P450 family 135